jgi:hypothetical protein
MAIEPRPWIKQHKPKRLSFSRFDYLPNVDAKLVTHHGHFISQDDVHTVKVFSRSLTI